MSRPITLKPRMSEKAYEASTALNKYVFNVSRNASKNEIIKAVESQFKVTVTGIKTLNQTGKPKFSYRKRSRPQAGAQASFKKAYVTLKEGESIPIFAAYEEEEKKAAQLQEQTAKSAAKQAKKEKS